MLVEVFGNFPFDVAGKKFCSWLNGMLEIVCVPMLAIGMCGFDCEPLKLIILFRAWEYLPPKIPLSTF